MKSATSASSRPRRSTSCARSPPSSSGRCCMFSGGKDSIVLLRLAEKAFRPARFPFPMMHVDTGHNFPEVIEFRDRRVAELGERLIVASVQDSIDARPRRRGDRAARVAQPPADRDAAGRDRRAPLRRGDRRRPPRRGARARQGADLLLPRRLRRVGPQESAPRGVGSLQRPHRARRARPGVPDLQLDRARRLAVHRATSSSSCPRSTSRTRARCSSATGCCTPTSDFAPSCRERSRSRRSCATAPSGT